MEDKKRTMSTEKDIDIELEKDKEIDLESDKEIMIINDVKNEKYFWVKLFKDFFERADVRILKKKTNGKEMVLLYLELLVKSAEFDGKLMMNSKLPYDTEMIADLTDTKIDLVRAALKLYEHLGWIEILNNEVLYMKEFPLVTGYDSKYALRKRQQRERQKQAKLTSQEQLPTEPTQQTVKGTELESIISNYTQDEKLKDLLNLFVSEQFNNGIKMSAGRMKAHLGKLNDISESELEKLRIIQNAIAGGYKGFFPLSPTEKEQIRGLEKKKGSIAEVIPSWYGKDNEQSTMSEEEAEAARKNIEEMRREFRKKMEIFEHK